MTVLDRHSSRPASAPRIDDRRPTERRRRVTPLQRIRRVIFFAVLLFVTVVWLFPFIVVAFNSLHVAGNLGTHIAAWFSDLTTANYPRAWRTANLSMFLVNSAILAVIKVPLGLLISAMCAFGLSRFTFRFRRTTLATIIGVSAIPMQIPLIALFRMMLDIGLLDTYTGLILAYLAFGIPFQTLFMLAYFNQIPIELEESARIDGAGPWRYFWSVILPLSRPVLAALFVLDFVSTWNEFPIALTLLQTYDWWTVPLGLLSFLGPYTNDYQLLSSAIVIAAVPVLVVYFAMQRFFVSGLTAGAVKG